MHKTAPALIFALAVTPALAQVKDCNELKAEIDTKITNNGVKVFTTTIVPMDAPEDGAKVVGTCDGQTMKILYKRGVMPESAGAPAATTATPSATSKQ